MRFLLTPILTLVAIPFVYHVRRQRPLGWRHSAHHGGYWWTPYGKFLSRANASAAMGIMAPTGFEFELREERWLDRVFKAIGLAVEFQVEDWVFDRTVYIVSDDKDLLRVLVQTRIRHNLLNLFILAKERGYQAPRIRARDGRLWVELSCEASSDHRLTPTEIEALAPEVVPWLRAFSDHLERMRTVRDPDELAPGLSKAALLDSLVISLGAIGLLQSMGTGAPSQAWTLDLSGLVRLSFVSGAVLLAGLLILAIGWLGRSARLHVIVVEIFFIGSVGAVSSSFALLRDLNIELDRAAAAQRDVRLVRKFTRNGDFGRSYYVELVDWTGETEKREFEVLRGQYERFGPGETVHLDEHPGALGYRWIENLRPGLRDSGTKGREAAAVRAKPGRSSTPGGA